MTMGEAESWLEMKAEIAAQEEERRKRQAEADRQMKAKKAKADVDLLKQALAR